MDKEKNTILHFLYELLPYRLILLRREYRYRNFLREINAYSSYKPSIEVHEELKDCIIWVFWWQGVERAPKLVKRCIESIKEHAGIYKVVLLDRGNYSDYVDIDSFILDMVDKDKLSFAHFSDILRLYLLSNYGGMWIDSTVYMTDNVPDIILESELFVFKGSWQDSLNLNQESSVSSWFIKAKSNNTVINETLGKMLGYIRKHKTVYNYYMMHLIITNEFRKNRMFWDNIPVFPNVMPHILQFCMIDKPYTKEVYSEICSKSFCHKLSYRFDPKEGSVLEHIICDEL